VTISITPSNADAPQRRRPRRAFSLIEFNAALVLLGIAFTGMFPLVVMQSRGLRSLEKRYARTGDWYLAPSTDLWARKLGASASLVQTDPGPLPTPQVLLTDDEDAVNYTDLGGGWTREENPLAFRAVHRRHPPPDPPTLPEEDHAIWQVADIAPGWYSIQATWQEASDQATDARYVFYDGGTLLGEATVSQQVAPVGTAYEGKTWQTLTTQYLRNGTAKVQLNGQATGFVVADAVRIVLVENDVRVISFERSLGSEEVTAHVSVNVLIP
jgi:hypothetical protein